MSRLYQVITVTGKELMSLVRHGDILGVTHEHRPYNTSFEPNLWPDAIKGFGAIGWFEGDFLLFWGSQNEAELLHRLDLEGIVIRSLN